MVDESGWTKERGDLVEKLWGEGLTAEEIAKEIGGFEHCEDGGRHAILGFAYRRREKAKKDKNAAALKFWTREKSPAPGPNYKKEQSTSFGKPLTNNERVHLLSSVPDAHIPWPTDAEVKAAWMKQMLAAK